MPSRFCAGGEGPPTKKSGAGVTPPEEYPRIPVGQENVVGITFDPNVE